MASVLGHSLTSLGVVVAGNDDRAEDAVCGKDTREGCLARWTYLRKDVAVGNGNVRRVLDLGPGWIPRGRLTCVLGPSGCGKTTLLSVLGLVDHDFESDIDICLDGHRHQVGSWTVRKRMRESGALRRRLGYVFQEIRVRTGATALENVVDPMTYLGLGRRSQRTVYARKMLGLFGLADPDLDRPISAFSGGMQQRTGLARALSVGPDVVVADEPTAQVDDKLADSIYRDLKRRSAEMGITVIVATHDEQMAERHADHILRFQPTTDDESAMNVAKESGRWLYTMNVERENTNDVPPSGAGIGLQPASFATSIGDMVLAALGEFLPLTRVLGRALKFLLFGWMVALMGLVTHRPRKLVDGIPPHRYVPILVSIVTFGMLAAMGFALFGVKSAIVAFQREKLDSLQVLRRVRVESPGDFSGNAMQLDGESVRKAVAAKGINVVHFEPVFELGGEALTAGDRQYMRDSERWAEPQLRSLLHPEQVDGIERGQRRVYLNVMGADPGQPLALDVGLPKDGRNFGTGKDGLPDMWIARNEWAWLFGNFDALPNPDDKVGMLIVAAEPVRPAAEGSAPNYPPSICVNFNIGGHLAPKAAPKGFESKVQKRFYLGAIRNEVRNRILAWQADPLNPASAVPASWLCEGTPVNSGYEYVNKDSPKTPRAQDYDFFAESPEQALALEDALDKYAIDNHMVFGGVVAERGFIKEVVRLIRLAEIVGFALHVLPIAVGGVILWLVVHEILYRRRDDLLLFLVMGAPAHNLHIQSFILAVLVVLPGIAFGYLLGGMGPALLAKLVGEGVVPAEMLKQMKEVGIGPIGVAQTTLAAIGFAMLASVTVVKSVLSTNPAAAFRGMQ